jgi:Fe-S cluster assembly ATP-binding protein
MTLLTIKNLDVDIHEKTILKGLNLTIPQNTIHAIMGPNGCGKSTLSKVLAGHTSYQVRKGEVKFHGKDLLSLSIEERAQEGLFLAFQSPVEISGLPTFEFLRIAFNQKQKHLGAKELDPLEFLTYCQEFLQELKISEEFFTRNFNEGFSGGEKKRNEILQILVLKPQLVILDEIDSGVDVDSLKLLCHLLKKHLPKESSILLITHYPRILEYLQPDSIHLLLEGKIGVSGGLELAKTVEEKGYDFFLEKPLT